MARRGQRLGLLAVAAGTIGAAVVALVLVIGLQQELASMRDALASRTTELGDLRTQVVSLEDQLGDQGPAAATTTRLTSLEAQLAALEGQLGDTTPAAATTIRLTSLEDRVVALENATTAPAGAVHPVITARHFQLVDDRGQELAVLGVDQVGFPELRLVRGVSPAHAAALALGWTQHGPSLRILDAAGNAPVFVGVTDQGPALTLNASGDSGAGASLQVDAQGASTLALTDNDGLAQAALTLSPAAGVSVPSLSFSRWTVFGPEGLSLGFDANGPEVVLSNLADRPRIRLGFAEGNRPSVSVHDASAAPRVEMVDTDEMVGLRLKDATGHERAALLSDRDGAALRLSDAAQVRAILGGHTTGGTLGFLDGQGVLRTTLGFTGAASLLGFFDEHETTRVSLLSTSDAGELAFLDEQATVRAALVSSPVGPALNLNDAQGVLGVTLRIGDAVRVLGLTDDTGNSGVTMSVVNGTPSLILSDERQVPRVIMGIDSTTLEPILLTLDAEGNETWRSGPAGGT